MLRQTSVLQRWLVSGFSTRQSASILDEHETVLNWVPPLQETEQSPQSVVSQWAQTFISILKENFAN